MNDIELRNVSIVYCDCPSATMKKYSSDRVRQQFASISICIKTYPI